MAPPFKTMEVGEAVDLTTLDKAKPAPKERHVWAAEDTHPWSKAEDAQLRVAVLANKVGNMPIPWDRVALKLNSGHNSGSCMKRFSELPALKFQDASQIYFGGKKTGGEVTTHRKAYHLQPDGTGNGVVS